MGAEIKKRLSRYRYYELKFFCMQYRDLKKRQKALETSNEPDKLIQVNSKISLIEETAKKADANLSDYIMLAVTKGCPYEYMKTYKNLAVTKDEFLESYRRFFDLLDEAV